MKNLFLRSAVFRYGIVLILALSFLGEVPSVSAYIRIAMQLDVDMPTTVIGQTVKLTIRLTNGEPEPLRVTGLNCSLTGASVVRTSSFDLPILNPNSAKLIYVYYRAVAPGTTMIECALYVTNTVTGEQTVTGTANQVVVLGETRLFMTTYSSTQVATVGQTFFIINKFGNRGTTPFTNVYISCTFYGGDVALGGATSLPPSTLAPGQATFVQQRWVAQHPGYFVEDCSITGTDATGTAVTIPSERIAFWIK